MTPRRNSIPVHSGVEGCASPHPARELDISVLVVTSMRIPHCGGASTHINLLLRNLPSMNVRPSLLSGDAIALPLVMRAILRLARKLGSENETSSIFSAVRRLQRQIYSRLQQQPVQLIHAHDVMAVVAARLAVGNRLPVILTVHGPQTYESLSTRPGTTDRALCIKWGIERIAYATADCILGVDNGQRSHACQHGGEISRSCVIPNAVDADALQDLVRRTSSHFRRPTYRYAFTCRRLVQKNGLLFGLRGYCGSDLPEQGIHFVIAGEGPERATITQYLANRRPLARESVHLLGAVDYASSVSYTSHADVVLVPSIPHAGVVEATSLSLLEALALGKAVVASDIGGLHDVLHGTSCGLLVEPDNDGQLSDALKTVVADRDQAATLGVKAQALVRAQYGVDQWIRKHAEVYQRTLGASTGFINAADNRAPSISQRAG
jgi:glycosyltransferase involved in cell wall biosynthesis